MPSYVESPAMTPYAAEAVREATDPISGRIDAARLARALVQHPDSTAGRILLRCEERTGQTEPPPASVGTAGTGLFLEPFRLLERARGDCLPALDELVGTEHLLLALLRCSRDLPERGTVGLPLDDRAFEAELNRYRRDERAGRLPRRPSGDEPASSRRPSVVTNVAVFFVVTAVGSALVGLAVFTQAGYLREGRMDAPAFLLCTWGTALFVQATALSSLSLYLGSQPRRRWPIAMGALFARSATAGGWLALLLASTAAGWRSAWEVIFFLWVLPALPCAWIWLLAQQLWVARAWFGVEPRDGWTTLLREGRWSMLFVVMLDVGFPSLVVAALFRHNR